MILRRALLLLLVLLSACALYRPDFGPQIQSVPSDQIHNPAADLNQGPLAVAVESARMK